MRPFRALLPVGACVCLMAQTPPAQPPKPQPPPMEGTTMPIQLVPPEMTTVAKDKVIVQVNDTKITAGQLDQILEAYPESSRVYARGPGRQQFIDMLVKTLVLSQEGKRRKLDEDPTYKMQAEYSLAAILANQASLDITRNVQVDEASMKKYLADHHAEYETVKARHILVRMKGSPLPVKPGQRDLTEDEALAKARELRAKIQAGADFAEVAKAESDDAGSASSGGTLAPFGHGQSSPTFEEAAFKMKAGELSEPVKSPFGYHLILVEENRTKSLDELRVEIELKIRPELAKKQVDDLINKAKVILDPDLVPSSKISK